MSDSLYGTFSGAAAKALAYKMGVRHTVTGDDEDFSIQFTKGPGYRLVEACGFPVSVVVHVSSDDQSVHIGEADFDQQGVLGVKYDKRTGLISFLKGDWSAADPSDLKLDFEYSNESRVDAVYERMSDLCDEAERLALG